MFHVLKLFSIISIFALSLAQTGQAQASQRVDIRNQQIVILVGFSAGASYDINARMLANHMSKYIPGNRSIIVKNKPGAGGISMMNLAAKGTFTNTRRTLFVIMPPAFFTNTALLKNGAVRYDPAKFIAIGRIAGTGVVFGIRAEKGKSLKDARTREIKMGATLPTGVSAMYASFANKALNTKFKIITGHKGAAKVMNGIYTGEIHGTPISPGSWWRLSQFFEDETIIPILRAGEIAKVSFKPKDAKERATLEKTERFRQILLKAPKIEDFLVSPEDKELYEFVKIPDLVGRSFFVPENTPVHIVRQLRDAFNSTMNDDAFRHAMGKANLTVSPRNGEELEKLVKSALAFKDNPKVLKVACELARGTWADEPPSCIPGRKHKK